VESTAIEIVVTNEKDLDRRIDQIDVSHRPSPSPEREIRKKKDPQGSVSGMLSTDTSPSKVEAGSMLNTSIASVDSPPMSPLLNATSFAFGGGGSGAVDDEEESTTPPGSPLGMAPESPTYVRQY